MEVLDRPIEPVFPAVWRYFRRWATLQWFFVILTPLAAGVGLGARHRPDMSPIISVFGVVVATFLFAQLCSGRSSSNWGTYFRRSEPGRYWRDVALVAAIYAGLIALAVLAR